MTVLGCIQNRTSRYNTFVANRLATIHDLTDVAHWHFVQVKINHANLASRGFMPSENDKLTTWLSGSPFIQTCEYPTSAPSHHPLQLEEFESRESVMIVITTQNFVDSIMEQCGSWNKVKETTRLVLRFVKLIAKRLEKTTNEESIILKTIQEISFQDDYSRLQNNKQISAASKLV